MHLAEAKSIVEKEGLAYRYCILYNDYIEYHTPTGKGFYE